MNAAALDPGERQALCVARQIPDAVLLTDDEAAKKLAKVLGHRAHGTLGLLLLAQMQGLRSKRQLLNLLRSLPDRSSLHIKRSLLDEIITQAQERLP